MHSSIIFYQSNPVLGIIRWTPKWMHATHTTHTYFSLIDILFLYTLTSKLREELNYYSFIIHLKTEVLRSWNLTNFKLLIKVNWGFKSKSFQFLFNIILPSLYFFTLSLCNTLTLIDQNIHLSIYKIFVIFVLINNSIKKTWNHNIILVLTK